MKNLHRNRSLKCDLFCFSRAENGRAAGKGGEGQSRETISRRTKNPW